METIYDVDYFIRKFQAIPEELWLVRHFSDGCGSGCVMYHGRGDARADLDKLFIQNQHLFTDPRNIKITGQYIHQMINNGDDPLYQQPTAKQRILAALYAIKAGRKPTESPIQKVIYKTVLIDSTVKDLQENLREN